MRAARSAGRCARRGRRAARRCGSSRSRGSAATTSPAGPTTRRAVGTLRARKHREDKPFALMVAVAWRRASALVELGDAERALLSGAAAADRARRAPGGAPVAQSVAPGAAELGVMLPYSPLHHLLLGDVGAGALVMTSGNVSDEPIAYRDEDAVAALGRDRRPAARPRPPDRDAHRRLGRARARWRAGGRCSLRRSRGYVPAALTLPGGSAAPDTRLRRRAEEHVLPGPGQPGLGRPSHRRPARTTRRCARSPRGSSTSSGCSRSSPEVVAHDLHPEYLSTKYALERDGVELIGVQHHHAHLAACLAEHGEPGTAVGAIFDGSGYGTRRHDLGRRAAGRRCWAASAASGTLRAVRLPGGDRAIREPWRMACAWLRRAAGDDAAVRGAARRVDPRADGRRSPGLLRPVSHRR